MWRQEGMLKRLLFDCSGDIATVAVFEGEELRSEWSVTGRKNHAAVLLPAISDCLKDANIDFAEIREIYVCSGPGSFTGVKVGLSTALGLTQPTSKKLCLFPYPALILAKALSYYPRLLDGVSNDFRENSEGGRILLTMDAGRGEKYCTSIHVEDPTEELPSGRAHFVLSGADLDVSRRYRVETGLLRADRIGKSFEYPDLPVRLFFDLPPEIRALFLSDRMEPLYFRRSQAEEALEMHDLSGENAGGVR